MASYKLLSWSVQPGKTSYRANEWVQLNVRYKVSKEGFTYGGWSVNATIIDGYTGQELDRDGHNHFETTQTGEGTLTPRFIMPSYGDAYVSVKLDADGELLNYSPAIIIPLDTSAPPSTKILPPPLTTPSTSTVTPTLLPSSTPSVVDQINEQIKKIGWTPILLIGGGLIALLALMRK